MSWKHLAMALCAVTLLSLPVACNRGGDTTPDAAGRNPVELSIGGEDTPQVSLDAPGDGYRPGGTEPMHLAVRNTTEQDWHGSVCIQLLEPAPSGDVISLAREDFELEPGAGTDRDIAADLPAGLSSGTFGLALVVNTPAGPTTSVAAVHVGEGQPEPFHGDWPTQASLEACPAP